MGTTFLGRTHEIGNGEEGDEHGVVPRWVRVFVSDYHLATTNLVRRQRESDNKRGLRLL
jgi:hypothetical protein